jgi:hypothetical protein
MFVSLQGETPEEARERRAASKKKLKEKFDQDHDDEKEKVCLRFIAGMISSVV